MPTLIPPSGTVTFLFTDIEGSTRLAQEFPDKLHDLLEKHHSILDDSIESNGGFVFRTVGDAYCCAFAVATDAIKAAVEIQRRLAGEDWGAAPVKVRIGIHSGSAEWNGNNYMGYITLARSARVMSSAYGEQVIVSEDAHRLAEDYYGAEFSFRDLGIRRLKDVIQPLRLFQVLSPGLREDFPPLKTLDARPNNLPVQLTSFVGREEEMRQIRSKLKNARLLTLTGPGGTGKTRLALQIAADVIDQFANGVWFVELDTIHDPESLPQEILLSLGVKEEAKQNAEQTLSEFLNKKELLLVLDNCEHLIESCSLLAEKLLKSSAGVKILATSREALRCLGEQTHHTLSLSAPDPKEKQTPEKITQYEAVRLFIERALSANPKFRVNNDNAAAVAAICHRLDGIPLAIELAAARTKILSPEKIHDRLDDRFSLLTGGRRTAIPRQQTLRAMIDWSYDLLAEDEKELWSMLSVFSGGWTLEAAETVCRSEDTDVMDLLQNLREKSIVIFDEASERYRMLETIRQYGDDKLRSSGRIDDIKDRHLEYFRSAASEAGENLKGPEMKTWLVLTEAESANIEKAFYHSMMSSRLEDALLIAGAMGYYWETKGMYSEGRHRLESALNAAENIRGDTRARALVHAGRLAHIQGDIETAKSCYSESMSIFRESGNQAGIAAALKNFGLLSYEQGEYKRSEELHEEALEMFRQSNDKRGTAYSLNDYAAVLIEQGKFERAKQILEEGLVIHREINDKRGIAFCLNNLASICSEQAEYEQAVKYLNENSRIFNGLGDRRGEAYSLNSLGNLAINACNYDEAFGYLSKASEIFREIGDRRGTAFALCSLGNTAFHNGDAVQAGTLLEECIGIFKAIDDKAGLAFGLFTFGGVLLKGRDHNGAKLRLSESLELSREISHKPGAAFNLHYLGMLGLMQKEYGPAAENFSESLRLCIELGLKKEIALNIYGLAGCKIFGNDAGSAAMLIGFAEEQFSKLNVKKDNFEEEIFNSISDSVQSIIPGDEFKEYYEKGKMSDVDSVVNVIDNGMQT
ncbi:MAG: tetratricopeptide repeat protein [Ignavibacteria bacterium]|nr:tetratricopeptide repeat protein [Ignavibacteria bacterium]